MAKTTETRFTNQRNGYSSPPEKIWYPSDFYSFQKRDRPESVNTPIGHLRFLQHASFHWRHWDFCEDRKVAVIEFVESPAGPFQQAAREMDSKNVQMHHGLVSFFPEDGTVCRLVVTGSFFYSGKKGESTAVIAFRSVKVDSGSY